MEESYTLKLITGTAKALPKDLAYIAMAFALLVIARLLKDLMTPFKLNEEMTTKDNPALGMSVAGYYVAVLLICIGPLRTPPVDTAHPFYVDLLITGGYTLLGIVLLNISRVMVDQVLLREFSTVKEIIEDRNVGTGAVEMGAYVASGLVIASALHGQGGGPHITVVFFLLGQVGLMLYGALYRVTCRFDLHGEIERDNAAAGVAFGLNLVAVGILLTKGVGGDFISWESNLSRLGVVFVLGSIFLLALRYAIDFLLLPGAKMNKEIVEDRNLNVAWIEGSVLAGVAGILISVL